MQVTITARTIKRTIGALVVLAFVVGAVLVLPKFLSHDLPDGATDSKYQAITIEGGGQVFGDVQSPEDGFVEVRKAHRIAQAPAQGEGEAQQARVVPVTSDPTEPKSSVFIAQDQIVLIQALKEGSTIEKIIDGADVSPAPTPDVAPATTPKAKK